MGLLRLVIAAQRVANDANPPRPERIIHGPGRTPGSLSAASVAACWRLLKFSSVLIENAPPDR